MNETIEKVDKGVEEVKKIEDDTKTIIEVDKKFAAGSTYLTEGFT